MIDRRTWLVALLGLLGTPVATTARPPARLVRIGLLGGSTRTSREASHIWAAFSEGLQQLGYVEGRNMLIEGRFYGDDVHRLPSLAAELVRLPVDVIVAGASPAPEAARRATSTIPIVMANHPDPVGTGLVASLAKPGANVTGLSLLSPDLRVKQLQLLKEMVPRLTSVAVLSNPATPLHRRDVTELEAGAQPLKVRVEVVEASAASEFTEAFSVMVAKKVGALIILAGSTFFTHAPRLAELAARNRLPSTYAFREYAEAGGLMSYGADLRDNFRRAAGYVDRILNGAPPGDLPIEQPTRFELVINLRAAKALGLSIPHTVLARADRIIE
jgi:putative ABC transport system substrate-binding protein